jgi:hypothetical protein
VGGEIAEKVFAEVLEQARANELLSDEHFSVDGTLIEAWASHKSFQRKMRIRPPGGRFGQPDGQFSRRKAQRRHASIVGGRHLAGDGARHGRARIEGDQQVTVGADNGYDTRGFVREMRERNVTPHVAQAAPSTAARRGTLDTGSASASGNGSRKFRVVKDGGHAAQDAAPRNLQSEQGLHLCGGGLQSGADEEPRGGSLRISSGRSVPESQ